VLISTVDTLENSISMKKRKIDLLKSEINLFKALKNNLEQQNPRDEEAIYNLKLEIDHYESSIGFLGSDIYVDEIDLSIARGTLKWKMLELLDSGCEITISLDMS
jgi:SMC interacting uncharacterized protein involved in chromosome segregation